MRSSSPRVTPSRSFVLNWGTAPSRVGLDLPGCWANGIESTHRMAERNKITYVFRRPKFPLICDLDGELIAATSTAAFQSRIARFELPSGKHFCLVDVTGEGWALHTEWMAVSPLTIKKRWTKFEIIRLFNQSANARRMGEAYPETRLSSRSVSRVVTDIAALINRNSLTKASTRPPKSAAAGDA